MSRPSHVHPSGLSPAEHDCYAPWMLELDGHLSHLGRGLRIGEMLGFIRKRTPVERESEIMAFFGSMQQQQSLGVGEFIAILRLLAHARTCSTLTRDHIFIQTSPLILTNEIPSKSANPFFRTYELDSATPLSLRSAAASPSPSLSFPPPPKKLANTTNTTSLRDAVAGKKKAPAPPPPASLAAPLPNAPKQAGAGAGAAPSSTAVGPAAKSEGRESPETPIAGSNPFRRAPASVPSAAAGQPAFRQSAQPSRSPADTRAFSAANQLPMANFPPSPPESSFTAKSPPLPPRPPSSTKPSAPPPKHPALAKASEAHAQTPTSSARAHTLPPIGPTNIDIISTSAVQAQHTGQSNASSAGGGGGGGGPNRPNKRASYHASHGSVSSNLGDTSTVRLLGSSHIGLNSTRLRKEPPSSAPTAVSSALRANPSSSSSSEDALSHSYTATLHKNRSDSSLSSLSGMLPRLKRGETVSSFTSDGRTMGEVLDEEDEEILSPEYTAPSASGGGGAAGLSRSKTVTARSSTESAKAKDGELSRHPHRPPPPFPRRKRPESLHILTDPISRSQRLGIGDGQDDAAASRGPASASASVAAASTLKGRTASVPIGSHGRSASASFANRSHGLAVSASRQSRQHYSEGLARHVSLSHSGPHTRSIDLLQKGKDVSQEWLEKARAGMKEQGFPVAGSAGGTASGLQKGRAPDRESLIDSSYRRMQEDDEDEDDDDNDNDDEAGRGSGDDSRARGMSVQDRRRELERMRAETEAGWARLQ